MPSSIALPPLPLQTILPAYPYEQFADDIDIQAFFSSYNELAQSYLTWFNNTPLPIYTNPSINGALLDWVAEGIYGLVRPVFASRTTKYIAGLNARAVNVVPINGKTYLQSNTATLADDDYFKRVLTWWLYLGNGRRFNTNLLRLKVARFLYGVDGTDITLSQAQTVHIEPQSLPAPPAPVLSAISGGSLAAATYYARQSYVTAIGETQAINQTGYGVLINHLLVADSPPPQDAAIGYNIYVGISANINIFLAGLNEGPVNEAPINGSQRRNFSFITKQNTDPIPIGTAWTEPTGGLITGAHLPVSNTSNFPGNFIITVPDLAASQILKQALEQGFLSFPFQLSANVVVS